ncbi:SDR family NAD(P)-dependent oxidoreductase [Marinoscillum pacificum]|uniref:SDR family NAD(P)-dependent oxidoreductase n=1 Tax=Marinoscillum pacificum TaxID=392723 RepID=UPI002157C565|nr:SDR family oxidoreductase [Marinoscillum pacificum]
MDFAGKHIVVVGGTSGIGEAVVSKLLAAGAEVTNIARREHSEVSNISLDVTSDFDAIEGLPEQIDGLVYCPGNINLKPFQSLKPEQYLEDFNLNVLGGIKVLKACLKSLRKSETSSIVFFSTVAVHQGMNYHTSVAASKGALEGVVKSLAAEFARQKIRVNAIAPSLTDTPLASALLATEEKRKASEERHPLKKVGSADEIAEGVLYLLSDATKWMTGQILHLDGGMSSVRPL